MPLFDPRVWTALCLTSLGAAGTGLGGLLVVVQPKFDFKKLGYLQGLAAGLMTAISFFDLYPESAEAVGEATALLWFFIGAAFFAAVVAVIPEPDTGSMVIDLDEDDSPAALAAADDSAGASAGGGGAAAAAARGLTGSSVTKRVSKAPRQGTARWVSMQAEVPPAGLAQAFAPAMQGAKREARRKVLLSGLITALGIALHNFPEGVAVFLASLKSPSIGVSLAIAIALHNIPEGVAVALPVYFATGSRWRGFQYAFVSGLAEPAAVVVLGIVFRAFNMDKVVIDCLLAAVGGIMAFLSLHELLPLAIEHAGKQAAVLCMFGGMAIMSLNLQLLATWMGDLH
ncbi:hypothetical protein QJQ45_016645 [Haematococcus lacustris]|nr:hypothetical protein QJQ45_016645 [Haematococcus lacustris]